jgi:carboxypeptidase C (cathepsin A)
MAWCWSRPFRLSAKSSHNHCTSTPSWLTCFSHLLWTLCPDLRAHFCDGCSGSPRMTHVLLMAAMVFAVLCITRAHAHAAAPHNQEGCASCTSADNCGETLNLSPLIASGKLSEARAASKVAHLHPLLDGSYSGLLTTDATKGDSLWFWFLPALSGAADAPTVVWLQGGPGAPSTYGMFTGA